MINPPPTTTLFPYTTLFRSQGTEQGSRNDNTDDHRPSTSCIHCEAPDSPKAPNIPDGTTDSKVRIMFRDNPSITDRLREAIRSEEHTSELQSHSDLVCRLLL